MPAVRLQLSDGTTYQSEGKIDAVSGVIDQSTGSVSMRAVFPNDKNILRSGGTGNVVFPYTMDGIIIILSPLLSKSKRKKVCFRLANGGQFREEYGDSDL